MCETFTQAHMSQKTEEMFNIFPGLWNYNFILSSLSIEFLKLSNSIKHWRSRFDIQYR